jgi:hypothetical protein
VSGIEVVILCDAISLHDTSIMCGVDEVYIVFGAVLAQETSIDGF